MAFGSGKCRVLAINTSNTAAQNKAVQTWEGDTNQGHGMKWKIQIHGNQGNPIHETWKNGKQLIENVLGRIRRN